MNNQVAQVSKKAMAAAEPMVPAGYKQTEVGVIPEDWGSLLASEVINFFAGYSFSSKNAQASGVRWLKIANVGLNEIKWDAESYLPESFVTSFKDYLLKSNDVVMALTRPLLGDNLKVAKMKSSDSPALLNQRVAKLDALDNNNEDFIYYVVQRLDFIAAMNLAMAGSDPPNIGVKALGSIYIPVPSTQEQTAIANALSDMDALIGSLEALIAKKQAIKTATMQQLLTGRTRLPQFARHPDGSPIAYKTSELGEIPEDWEAIVLSKALTMSATYGVVTAGSFKNAGVPMVRGGDIKNGKILEGSPLISLDKNLEYSRTILQDGDVIIALVGYPGETAKVSAEFSGANISRAVGLLRLKAYITPDYLVHYLNSDEGRKNFLTPSAGSAQIVVNLVDLNKLNIPVPTQLEQTAIATILSDMDEEIQALEARLTKTRDLKHGMMQQLLTGKIRLIQPLAGDESHAG